MKLKLLKTAKTDIDLIDQLDREIKHINAFASKVKDKSLNVCLRMSFSKPAENKTMFDEDGSIVLNGTGITEIRVSGLSDIFNSYKKENTEDFKMDVSEVSVLQILGVLVCFKESERMAAVQRLTAIGIEL